MKNFYEMLNVLESTILKPGTNVKVPNAQGKIVNGKIVRYDNGEPHKSPFYVVDVGANRSEIVPAHKIKKSEDVPMGESCVEEVIQESVPGEVAGLEKLEQISRELLTAATYFGEQSFVNERQMMMKIEMLKNIVTTKGTIREVVFGLESLLKGLISTSNIGQEYPD